MLIYDLMENDELLLLSNDTMKQFHDIRQSLFTKMKHYYNQSIASTYYDESDMIRELETLKQIKQRHMLICKELKKRGLSSRSDRNFGELSNGLFTKL